MTQVASSLSYSEVSYINVAFRAVVKELCRLGCEETERRIGLMWERWERVALGVCVKFICGALVGVGGSGKTSRGRGADRHGAVLSREGGDLDFYNLCYVDVESTFCIGSGGGGRSVHRGSRGSSRGGSGLGLSVWL
ncbi:hypothetical protein Tco_0295804 [Tanacetum coccineum]